MRNDRLQFPAGTPHYVHRAIIITAECTRVRCAYSLLSSLLDSLPLAIILLDSLSFLPTHILTIKPATLFVPTSRRSNRSAALNSQSLPNAFTFANVNVSTTVYPLFKENTFVPNGRCSENGEAAGTKCSHSSSSLNTNNRRGMRRIARGTRGDRNRRGLIHTV